MNVESLIDIRFAFFPHLQIVRLLVTKLESSDARIQTPAFQPCQVPHAPHGTVDQSSSLRRQMGGCRIVSGAYRTRANNIERI